MIGEEEQGREDEGREQGRKVNEERTISPDLPGLPAQLTQVWGTRPPKQLWALGFPDILSAGEMTSLILEDAN